MSEVPPEPKWSVCKQCGIGLTLYTNTEGAKEWIHGPGADHAPVPVHGVSPTTLHCDFCTIQGVVLEYPVASFRHHSQHGLIANSYGAWMACERCAALIDQGKWRALARRVVRQMERRKGTRLTRDTKDQLISEVMRYHAQFALNRNGPARRVT